MTKQNVVNQRIPFARCRNCNVPFTKEQVKVTEVPAGNDFEVGVNCPNCGLWFHFYFLSKELKQMMQKPFANRKQRRAYQAMHNKFNKQKRKREGMKKINGRWHRVAA